MNNTVKNFNGQTNQMVVDFFKNAMDNFNLVEFYYTGKNSTDVNKLSVMPIHVIDDGVNVLVEAVKEINGDFLMRRYMVSGMADIVVSGCDIRGDSVWSSLEKEKDDIFPHGFADPTVAASINWTNWKMLPITNNVSPVVKGVLGYLPSHPESLIVIADNTNLIYANSDTLVVNPTVKISKAVLKVVDINGEQNVDNFKVGDKVAVNTDSKYFISKIVLTVVDIDKVSGILSCAGFNKNRDLYEVVLPANVMKVVRYQNS